jgi:hypothetical protein
MPVPQRWGIGVGEVKVRPPSAELLSIPAATLIKAAAIQACNELSAAI